MPKVEIHADLPDNRDIEIIFPDKIDINSQHMITVPKFDKITMKITIDDARIVSLNPNTFIITPREFGSFKIKVITKNGPDTSKSASGGLPPKLLASKEVEIGVVP